ncbi:MAG: pilus assembly protein [Proteobacteria bacterium]|nr:pilus assembly protein [Pseudomonadota bacterium]
MVIRCLIWIGLIGALLSPSVSAGMFSNQRQTDFGASFESAKSNQILNPAAGKDLEPVPGFDGQAAQITLEKYREDFGRPAPREVYSISIGGIGQK